LLPAWPGTSLASVQRAAWKSHIEIDGLQERGRDPLALPRRLALQQRRQDADGAVQARAHVATANARPHRATTGMPVTHIRPPMPWAIWSKPARSA